MNPAIDIVTGIFELGAALMVWLNIPAIIRDKQVKGVSIWPTLFFVLWSLWNLFLFPYLGLWFAFFATFPIIIGNTLWIALVLYYRRRV